MFYPAIVIFFIVDNIQVALRMPAQLRFIATQRDCRKTLNLKNAHKNLPPQAQKSLKCCQIVVWGTQNQVLFNSSVPLFKNYF
jgi:hypothetical protein